MPGRAVTILLVEDNKVDREAVTRVFTRRRLENRIEIASDGVEALDALRGTGGRAPVPRPYIVLLDLNLPRMAGLELLRAIRADEDLKTSVVFVLTTSNRDEDRTEAYRLGVAGYVVKRDVAKLVELLDLYWSVVELP